MECIKLAFLAHTYDVYTQQKVNCIRNGSIFVILYPGEQNYSDHYGNNVDQIDDK